MPTETARIRRAVSAESDRVASLIWRVREQNLGSIPPSVHPPIDMQTWMSRIVFSTYDVWVADDNDRLVATMILGHPDWIEHIYIDASHTGQGLGSRLIDLAKAELGGQVQLWTFQSNTSAGRFYESHGFEAVEQTTGDNEEGEPDVRYVFTPGTSGR